MGTFVKVLQSQHRYRTLARQKKNIHVSKTNAHRLHCTASYPTAELFESTYEAADANASPSISYRVKHHVNQKAVRVRGVKGDSKGKKGNNIAHCCNEISVCHERRLMLYPQAKETIVHLQGENL
jgi:hypothetical protein